MSISTVTANDVGIGYQDRSGTERTLLSGIQAATHPGSILCLAGRSGSGKTSLLRCFVGLQRPTSGAITWDEHDVTTLGPDAIADGRRSSVVYVDQAASLVEDLTVEENVVVPAVPDGRQAVRDARRRGNELLKRLGLDVVKRQRPASLSGGERQRVAVARALVMRSPVIVADEPTASLDRAWADAVIELLREQAERGCSVLVASHDPGMIAAADEVIRLTD